MRINKKIAGFIAEGEHQTQDFKYEISDARKIAKTLVAFANTNGGRLLIGVKDNGIIKGVKSEEEYYMLETSSLLYCKPKIDIGIEKEWVDGKSVLVAIIKEGNNKPYYALNEDERWLAYIRVEDENFLADIVQLQVWKNKKAKKGVFFKYTEKEKFLLKYMEIKGDVSLSQTIRLLKINRKNAIHLLAKLVSMDIVEIIFDTEQTKYALK